MKFLISESPARYNPADFEPFAASAMASPEAEADDDFALMGKCPFFCVE